MTEKNKKIEIKQPEQQIADKEVVLAELTPQTIAREVVSELKKQGLIKDNRSAFQKTEILLYNYNSFKETIKDRREEIKELKKYGTKEKSKSITTFSADTFFEEKREDERIAEKVLQIEHSIKITVNLIDSIDKALLKLRDDKYYDIIKLKYFENKTREEIAEYFDIYETTVTRNKNRLIGILKISLFPDDTIKEMIS